MKRIVIALISLLAVPASAGAATVVGDATTTPGGGIPAEFAFVQSVDGSGASYAFPASGVVTSMSATARILSTGPREMRPLVFRRVEGSTTQFVVVGGTDLAFSSTTATLKSGPTRIAVKAGDRLGGYVPSGMETSYHGGGGGIAAMTLYASPADGAGFTTSTGASANASVSATLEPDADSDGYGDETQDSCPTLAQIHAGPCATDLQVTATATPATVEQGQTTAIVATVTNAGTQPASATTATLTVGPGLEVVSASTADALGDIPAGAVRKIHVLLRGTAPGAASVGISVTSTVAETAPADNTAVTPVTVTAPRAANPAPTPTLSSKVVLCTVPKLTGKTKTQAKAALKKAGCKAGKVSGKKGKVRAQTIPAKTKVLAGTAVGFRIRK